jgi:hypothetical protein
MLRHEQEHRIFVNVEEHFTLDNPTFKIEKTIWASREHNISGNKPMLDGCYSSTYVRAGLAPIAY